MTPFILTVILFFNFSTIGSSALPGEQIEEPNNAPRQKRGGWGYDNFVINPDTAITTSEVVLPAPRIAYPVQTEHVSIAAAPRVAYPVHTEHVSISAAPRVAYPVHTEHVSISAAPRVAYPVHTEHVSIAAPIATRAIPIHPHSESFVWQSGPTYTYQLHQKYPSYFQYPSYPSYVPATRISGGWRR